MKVDEVKRIYQNSVGLQVKYSMHEIYDKIKSSAGQGHTFVMFYYGDEGQIDEVSEEQMELLKSDGFEVKPVDGLKRKFYNISGWS